MMGHGFSGGSQPAWTQGSGEDSTVPRIDGDRYEVVGEIGRGGMGRVSLVHDRWLGRMAARKELPADRPDLAARLWREARLGARLDHPGIVPIYDGGVDEQGRPWFVMRVFRGRTLRARVAMAGPEERRSLLRAVLAAAEAVAFAHHKGVVHRDLSPDNVLVGGPGEVQVVDWGLARDLTADAPEPSTPGGAVSGGGTQVGAVLGTVPWLSPEQARGEPVDQRSDVWVLGALVRFVLTGEPVVRDPEEGALARLARGDIDPLPADVPLDLAAILARCHALDPEERYPDAGVLADDLAGWLEGRPVSVYAYGALDRALHALRSRGLSPERLVGVGVVVAVVAAIGWGSTLVERDRALRAEREAREALVRADEHLAARLEAQAVRAFRQGALPEADVLAAEVLARRTSPWALGVMAGVQGTGGLERSVVASTPALRGAAPLREGGALGWTEDEVLWLDGAGRVQWREAWAPRDAAEISSGRVALLGQDERLGWLDLPTREVTWIDRSDAFAYQVVAGEDGDAYVVNTSALMRFGDGRYLHPCQGVPLGGVAPGAGWAVCADWSTVGLGPSGPQRRFPAPALASAGSLAEARALGDLGDDELVVGSLRGELVRWHAPTGVVRWQTQVGSGAIAWIRAAGRLVVVGGEQGGAALVDATTGALWGRLPEPDGVSVDVRWEGDQAVLRTWGSRAATWTWRPDRMPSSVPLPRGAAALGFSDDGSQLAVGMADGHLGWMSTEDGSGQWAVAGQGVVKGVTWTGEGWLAAQAAPDAGIWWPTGGQPQPLGGHPARRAGRDGALGPWVLAYGEGLFTWAGPAGGLTPLTGPGAYTDALDTPDGVLLLRPDGSLMRVTPGGVVPVGAVSPHAMWAADGRGGVWTGDERGMRALGPDGRPEGARASVPQLTAMAVSSEGRWLAGGAQDGSVHLFEVSDSGEVSLWALLPAHRARVSALRFSPDGAFLFSASWDATLRAWSVGSGGDRLSAARRWDLDPWEASARLDAMP